MKTTGQITDVSINFKNSKGKIVLDINTKNVETLDLLDKLRNKELDIEIKQHREKRSGRANRYFWQLIGELCELQNINPVEDYKRRVKELGIFRTTRIESTDFETLKKTWENWGEAWFCEKVDTEIINGLEFYIVNLYYGSSSFNTKQMSGLIDNLVQDCKSVGLETKPKQEIDSLLKEWEEEHKNGNVQKS